MASAGSSSYAPRTQSEALTRLSFFSAGVASLAIAASYYIEPAAAAWAAAGLVLIAASRVFGRSY